MQSGVEAICKTLGFCTEKRVFGVKTDRCAVDRLTTSFVAEKRQTAHNVSGFAALVKDNTAQSMRFFAFDTGCSDTFLQLLDKYFIRFVII